MEEPSPDRDAWLRMLYQVAHSDIRWAKEQGWRVTNWAILLYAAVVAVAKYLLPTQSRPTGFIVVNILILVAAILFLVELQGAGREARGRIDVLRQERGSLGLADLHDHPADNHTFYLCLQIAIVAVGFALSAIIVWQLATVPVAA